MEVSDKIVNNMVDAVAYDKAKRMVIPMEHSQRGGVTYEVQLVVTSEKKNFIMDEGSNTSYKMVDFVRKKHHNQEPLTYEELENFFVHTLKWGKNGVQNEYEKLLKLGEIFEVEGYIYPLDP